jgi:endonuclease G
MLEVSKEIRALLRKALVSSYRSYASLDLFVSENFNDFYLAQIATTQATGILSGNLITYFEEMGEIELLILALSKEKPNNPEVKKLLQHLKGFLEQSWDLDPLQVGSTDNVFHLPDEYTDVELQGFLPQPRSYETDVGILSRGLRLANAVCKITFRDCSTTGTGILVASNLVLTNYHVLNNSNTDSASLSERAKAIIFKFGDISQDASKPNETYDFSVAYENSVLAFSTPSELDYALIQVESKITDACSPHIDPIVLSKSQPKITSQHGLNILQHPQGGVMKVSLSSSGIVKIDANQDRVWYVNRTQGGSSGSPCFNQDWNLVALHHASIARGFGSIGEGILLSSILKEINGFLR